MPIDFRTATDDLLAAISHDELAKTLGVSVATVRQARLADDAKAHRNPPEGWERVVFKIAVERSNHFKRLAARFKGL